MKITAAGTVAEFTAIAASRHSLLIPSTKITEVENRNQCGYKNI
jgi:hypothetical protein